MDNASLFSLDNKVVLITGGSGYLGSAMSEVVVQLGGSLVLASRNGEKNRLLAEYLTQTYGNIVMSVALDLEDGDSIDAAIQQVEHRYGRVDVLINNSYYGAGQELMEMSEEDWLKGIDGSINGTFRITRRVLAGMLECHAGRIINVASMYGMVAPDVSVYEDNEFYNPCNYGAGKAAIIQFTKYIGAVYGKEGITCNCISPGPFPSSEVQQDKEFIARLSEKVPLGRIGKPEELQGVIALLASDASSYINGANIAVDGGWTIW